MSTFVVREPVRQEELDWGTIGWRLVPATGAHQLVLMMWACNPAAATASTAIRVRRK
jgi:hypothetical protein